MRRKASLPLLKVTLNVYAEDWDKLATLHPRLGPSRVTRELIHQHVRKVEEQAAQHHRPLSQAEIDDVLGQAEAS